VPPPARITQKKKERKEKRQHKKGTEEDRYGKRHKKSPTAVFFYVRWSLKVAVFF
jgi:hypothetical protein